MPKRLEEKAVKVVEQYKKLGAFYMDAFIVCHSTFMVVFTSIEEDLCNINANFPLENLSCMKDYLAL